MLNVAKVKQFRSLQQKKFRQIYKQFLIQGDKIVNESIHSTNKPDCIIATSEWIEKNVNLLNSNLLVEEVNSKQMQQISTLRSVPDVIAVMNIVDDKFNFESLTDNLCLGLDCIQDPGNMGTVLRIADWFNITNVICSPDTVDYTNPKVIQASMGAFLRVQVSYVDLAEQINKVREQNKDYSVYGSFMDGESVYSAKLNSKGLIIMGNEGKGISSDLESLCSDRIAIPHFPLDRQETESLNISVAAGIICSEFRRPRIY
jgi:TrmH family RNA methyltransferase